MTPREALEAAANELAFNSGTPEPRFVCMLCDGDYKYDGGPWDALRIRHAATCSISLLRSAVEDQERLDWLEKSETDVHYTTAGMWRLETVGRVTPSGPITYLVHRGDTLRTALDAARTPNHAKEPNE